MTQLPSAHIDIDKLASGQHERHESLVALFGQLLMSARSHVLSASTELVESDDARERLARLFKEPFENVARLPANQRREAIEFGCAIMDSYVREILRLLTSVGTDLRVGENLAVRFRLDLELLDERTGETVIEETINRDGQKSFVDYWGTWLNRFGRPTSENPSGTEM